MLCENVARRLGVARGAESARGVLALERLGAANLGDFAAARAALGRVRFVDDDHLLPKHQRLVTAREEGEKVEGKKKKKKKKRQM